ncbi:MAG TPA: hypothetical protein VFV38_19260 [Ktedonobacteraceae bacterium]|nr:hypothetical protein [Ktedonobacteraceae bacterium]
MNEEHFKHGFRQGWEASRHLEWVPLDELDENAGVMRRAEEDGSLGYWCGYKSGQQYFAGQSDESNCVDEHGMLTAYDYRQKR